MWSDGTGCSSEKRHKVSEMHSGQPLTELSDTYVWSPKESPVWKEKGVHPQNIGGP